MAHPADFAGVATVGVASLADDGMMFPADLAVTVTMGVAPGTVGGMTFPADPAGAVTIGVADRTKVVDVLKCGSGGVGWDDRMLPIYRRHTWTPSQQDVDRRYANYVGYAPMEVSEVVPVAGCFGSLLTGLPDQLCSAQYYMTCWDKLEAMSDDSYDSYEGVDCQPRYFDYDDPRDYE